MKFVTALLNAARVKALGVPEWHAEVTTAQQIKAVQLAEQLGFVKVKVPEHFAIPADHIELSGDHYPHATTALSFLAGVTTKIQLASGITILPLVHPIAQAKMWATLDWLSNGRAVMNVGVGWLKEEFDLMGVDFEHRGAICEEQIQAMLALWTNEVASYEGKYFQFKDIAASPRPERKGGIPIWFGGDVDAVLRRVARYGAGWQPFLTKPDQLPAKMDYIRSQKDYHGRPIELCYSMSNLKLGDGHVALEAPPEAFGKQDVGYMLDIVGKLTELGVTETMLQSPPLASYEAYLDWMRWVSEEIMPKAGAAKVAA